MFEVAIQSWFFWCLAGVLTLLGLRLLYRGLLRDRSCGRPRCPRCWYDLSGAASLPAAVPQQHALTTLPVTCPECGRVTSRRRQLHRTRRHWFTTFAGVLLIALAAYGYEVRHRLLHYGENWKTAFIPNTAYILTLAWVEKETFELVSFRYDNRMLPNKGQPNGRGFWKWQDWLYQSSLDNIVESEPITRNGTITDLRESALHLLLRMANADDERALAMFVSHLDHPEVAIRRQAMNWAQSLQHRMLPWRDAVIARLDDDDEPIRQATTWVLARMGRDQCAGLSDEELCRVAGRLLDIHGQQGLPGDWYFSEMIRRGLPAIVGWLKTKAADPPKMRWGDAPVNLCLLTALHRIEGTEGPLVIAIQPAELRAKNGTLPTLKAHLRNTTNLDIGFQRHGDNRGERPMRWRFEVRDMQGNLMPLDLESFNFGGISSYGPLKPGETFDIDLNMSKFVSPLPPGEYRVTVQYHDSLQISSMADVTGLIILESKEVKLVVEP